MSGSISPGSIVRVADNADKGSALTKHWTEARSHNTVPHFAVLARVDVPLGRVALKAVCRLFSKIVPILALFGEAQSIHAAVLFSDISSKFQSGGIAIWGASSSFLNYGAYGFGFSPSATAVLEQIDVGAIFYVTGTNSVQFTLNSDSVGLPGAVLDSWKVSNLPGVQLSLLHARNAVPHTSITLNSSAEYWLIVYPGIRLYFRRYLLPH
jgi:hypothetical protein